MIWGTNRRQRIVSQRVTCLLVYSYTMASTYIGLLEPTLRETTAGSEQYIVFLMQSGSVTKLSRTHKGWNQRIVVDSSYIAIIYILLFWCVLDAQKKIPSPLFNVSIATWFKCIVRYSARITYMQNWNIGPLAFLLLLIRYFDANESELIIFTYLHLPASIFVISSQESSIIFWNVSFNKSTTATVSSEQAAAFEALVWVHSHLDFQQSWSNPPKRGENVSLIYPFSPDGSSSWLSIQTLHLF